MAAILEDGVLRLTGYVGDYYYDDGFTSGDVVTALAQVEVGSDLTVHINSPGGIATEGAAIHAILSARRGRTDIVVEGIAASAASLIAMAGETVTMSAGAVMMIHDPGGYTFGTAAEHLRQIEALETLATAYARVYADKSGKTVDECRAIMVAETWFSPEKAVEEGFADETTERKAEAVAAFDYRLFAHAPRRLTALAGRKNWRLPDAQPTASAVSTQGQHQEQSMTEKERADQLAAENATLRAQMAASQEADNAAELETLRAEKRARDNRDAIMALAEAKGREAQATALAEAGVPADKAKAILAAAPVPAPAEGTGANPDQHRRMNAEGLTGTGGQAPKKGDRTMLTAAVDARNKRR